MLEQKGCKRKLFKTLIVVKTKITSVQTTKGGIRWLASMTEMPNCNTSLMILGYNNEGKEVFREIIDNIAVIVRILQNPARLSAKINEKLGLV